MTEMKDATIKSAKPCRKMNELKEEERTHIRDVWTENRNQHGFQSKPIPVRWPLRWEVTDKKVTWSDEFLVAIRAYFGAMEKLVAIDFETATATKIPTARRQAMHRHEGLVPETNVVTNNDDVRDRGNDGALDGASLRLDVCGSCQS